MKPLKLCYCDASDENVLEDDCRECCLLQRQGLTPDEVGKCQFHGEPPAANSETGKGVTL